MTTTKVGTYKVIIGGEEYRKRVMQIRDFLCTDYFVVKVRADGRRIASHLNSNVHRHAISRIEATLSGNTAEDEGTDIRGAGRCPDARLSG